MVDPTSVLTTTLVPAEARLFADRSNEVVVADELWDHIRRGTSRFIKRHIVASEVKLQINHKVEKQRAELKLREQKLKAESKAAKAYLFKAQKLEHHSRKGEACHLRKLLHSNADPLPEKLQERGRERPAHRARARIAAAKVATAPGGREGTFNTPVPHGGLPTESSNDAIISRPTSVVFGRRQAGDDFELPDYLQELLAEQEDSWDGDVLDMSPEAPTATRSSPQQVTLPVQATESRSYAPARPPSQSLATIAQEGGTLAVGDGIRTRQAFPSAGSNVEVLSPAHVAPRQPVPPVVPGVESTARRPPKEGWHTAETPSSMCQVRWTYCLDTQQPMQVAMREDIVPKTFLEHCRNYVASNASTHDDQDDSTERSEQQYDKSAEERERSGLQPVSLANVSSDSDGRAKCRRARPASSGGIHRHQPLEQVRGSPAPSAKAGKPVDRKIPATGRAQSNFTVHCGLTRRVSLSPRFSDASRRSRTPTLSTWAPREVGLDSVKSGPQQTSALANALALAPAMRVEQEELRASRRKQARLASKSPSTPVPPLEEVDDTASMPYEEPPPQDEGERLPVLHEDDPGQAWHVDASDLWRYDTLDLEEVMAADNEVAHVGKPSFSDSSPPSSPRSPKPRRDGRGFDPYDSQMSSPSPQLISPESPTAEGQKSSLCVTKMPLTRSSVKSSEPEAEKIASALWLEMLDQNSKDEEPLGVVGMGTPNHRQRETPSSGFFFAETPSSLNIAMTPMNSASPSQRRRMTATSTTPRNAAPRLSQQQHPPPTVARRMTCCVGQGIAFASPVSKKS